MSDRIIPISSGGGGGGGPAGPPGPPGPPGAPGTNGVRGATWWNGNGVPGVIVGALVDDYYLDNLTGEYYQLDSLPSTWTLLGDLSPAAGDGASKRVFVYDTVNGTNSATDDVYETWALLESDLSAVDGAKVIQVANTGTVTVNTTLDLGKITEVTGNNKTAVTLDFAPTVKLNNAYKFSGGLTLNNISGDAAHIALLSAGNAGNVYLETTTVQAAGGKYFFEISGGTHNFYLSDGAVLGPNAINITGSTLNLFLADGCSLGASSVIVSSPSATVNVYANDFSVVSNAAFVGSAGVLNIHLVGGASVDVSALSGTFTSTITAFLDDKAERLSFDDSVVDILAPTDPQTVQKAIEVLATRLDNHATFTYAPGQTPSGHVFDDWNNLWNVLDLLNTPAVIELDFSGSGGVSAIAAGAPIVYDFKNNIEIRAKHVAEETVFTIYTDFIQFKNFYKMSGSVRIATEGTSLNPLMVLDPATNLFSWVLENGATFESVGISPIIEADPPSFNGMASFIWLRGGLLLKTGSAPVIHLTNSTDAVGADQSLVINVGESSSISDNSITITDPTSGGKWLLVINNTSANEITPSGNLFPTIVGPLLNYTKNLRTVALGVTFDNSVALLPLLAPDENVQKTLEVLAEYVNRPLSRLLFVDGATMLADPYQRGSISAPFDTIQEAVDFIVADGSDWVIVVSPNSYSQNLTIDLDKRISILSFGECLLTGTITLNDSITDGQYFRMASLNNGISSDAHISVTGDILLRDNGGTSAETHSLYIDSANIMGEIKGDLGFESPCNYSLFLTNGSCGNVNPSDTVILNVELAESFVFSGVTVINDYGRIEGCTFDDDLTMNTAMTGSLHEPAVINTYFNSASTVTVVGLLTVDTITDYYLFVNSITHTQATYVVLRNDSDINIQNVWHVAPNGSDVTGTGSINRPFLSVSAALDVASSGDTILVYKSSALFNADTGSGHPNNLKIMGVGNAVINGGSSLIDVTGYELINLTFNGAGIVFDSGGGHKIRDCVFDASSDILNALYLTGSQTLNNVFIGCTAIGSVLIDVADAAIHNEFVGGYYYGTGISDGSFHMNPGGPLPTLRVCGVSTMGALFHDAGNVYLEDVSRIVKLVGNNKSIVSTVALGDGSLYLHSVSVQQDDGSYGIIDKSGDCFLQVGDLNWSVSNSAVFTAQFHVVTASRTNFFRFSHDIYVDFTPINYTPTTPTVTGHFEGIDAALSTVGNSIAKYRARFTKNTQENSPVTLVLNSAGPSWTAVAGVEFDYTATGGAFVGVSNVDFKGLHGLRFVLNGLEMPKDSMVVWTSPVSVAIQRTMDVGEVLEVFSPGA